MSNKILTIGLLITVVIAIGAYFFPKQVENIVSAATPGTRFPHGITIGLPTSSPTNISKILTGTCTLLGLNTSQVASSTAPYDCAVTGAVSGDTVLGQLAVSTTSTNVLWSQNPGQGLGWSITSCMASTTAGFITCRLSNQTGGAAAPAASVNIASTTNYLVTSTQ